MRTEPKKKAPTRTEPWPAPLVSTTKPGQTGRLRYRVERAQVEIELTHRKRTEHARLRAVEGTIDLDPVKLRETRAELRADLLDLSFFQGSEEAPDVTLRALEVLGLDRQKSSATRELDRFVTLQITGFDAVPSQEASRANRATVTARGDLTLHHFRVPVSLELEVELDRKTADSESDVTAQRLLIRTRRPLVVSLTAHDLVPNPSTSSADLPAADGVRARERGKASAGKTVPEFGREVRVSAELAAIPDPAAKP
ncbi:MAG TPA: hypothetical protein VFQ61_27045 [Polyangiaceae bacterium]|nr:hypothetical protein [Polyangiaceae bacterium]